MLVPDNLLPFKAALTPVALDRGGPPLGRHFLIWLMQNLIRKCEAAGFFAYYTKGLAGQLLASGLVLPNRELVEALRIRATKDETTLDSDAAKLREVCRGAGVPAPEPDANWPRVPL